MEFFCLWCLLITHIWVWAGVITIGLVHFFIFPNTVKAHCAWYKVRKLKIEQGTPFDYLVQELVLGIENLLVIWVKKLKVKMHRFTVDAVFLKNCMYSISTWKQIISSIFQSLTSCVRFFRHPQSFLKSVRVVKLTNRLMMDVVQKKVQKPLPIFCHFVRKIGMQSIKTLGLICKITK